MNFLEHKIWHLPLIALLAFWLGACSSYQDDIYPEENDPKMTLLLSISTEDRTRALTRADNVTFEDPIDSREMMNTLRVLIVNTVTRQVAHNEYLQFQTPTIFKKDLKYPVEFSTKYTIYLVANEGGLPTDIQNQLKGYSQKGTVGAGVLEDLKIGSDAAGAPMIPAGDQPVPMTEIFEITTVDEGTPHTSGDSDVVQEETFFITRAASKFSFYFFKSVDFQNDENLLNDPTVRDWTIKEIKVTGLGKTEFLFPTATKYSPAKYDEDGKINQTGEKERDIVDFSLPGQTDGVGDYTFTLPNNGFKVADFPTRPESFDPNDPGKNLNTEQLATSLYAPLIYFPESKGKDGVAATGGNVGKFTCTINKYNAQVNGVTEFLNSMELDNLPHGLPRNTHVVVIVTIHPSIIEAEVAIIPFTAVSMKPDYGLERNDYGFIKGKTTVTKADGTSAVVDCWYDQNYYEPAVDENGNLVDEDGNPILDEEGNPVKPEKPVAYFLGPNKDTFDETTNTTHNFELVKGKGPVLDAEGKETGEYEERDYLLVYADGDDYSRPIFQQARDYNKNGAPLIYDENGDPVYTEQIDYYDLITGYERKASTLYMIIDVETSKRYIITPEAITKYKYDSAGGFYLDQLKQRTMLDTNMLIIPPDKDLPNGVFLSHRVIFEWIMLDYAFAAWNRLAGYYPKAWFDVFGNRYSWEEGDTKEKRENLLRSKYGDLVKYLDDNIVSHK